MLEAPGKPVVSVIVVNYNGKAFIGATLDALRKQDLDPALWECWLVDNASKDGSAEYVRENFPEVRLVLNPENVGFAAANNLVIDRTSTPYIALLNPDARPEPSWLSELYRRVSEAPDRTGAITSKMLFEPKFIPLRLEAPPLHAPGDGRILGVAIKRVEVVHGGAPAADVTNSALWESLTYPPEGQGPAQFRWTRPAGEFAVAVPNEMLGSDEILVRLTVRSPSDGLLRLETPRSSKSWPLTPDWSTVEFAVQALDLVDYINNAGGILVGEGYGADRGYQERDSGQYDLPQEVFLFCGGAVLLRRDALKAVGAFDPRFFLYYEDTDLSWRMWSNGWSVLYEPRSVVRHLHSASSGEWSPVFAFNVARNRLVMLAKNATPMLALTAVAHFSALLLLDLYRTFRLAVRQRRLTDVRGLRLRLRVFASFLRVVPGIVAERWSISRSRPVTRGAREIQGQWLRASR
jgi:GT2 family glycosyltransferase